MPSSENVYERRRRSLLFHLWFSSSFSIKKKKESFLPFLASFQKPFHADEKERSIRFKIRKKEKEYLIYLDILYQGGEKKLL